MVEMITQGWIKAFYDMTSNWNRAIGGTTSPIDNTKRQCISEWTLIQFVFS